MKVAAPVIDNRKQSDVLAELRKNIPGYTPEWAPAEGAAGSALMFIFARYMSILTSGLNQVPNRSLLAFLDMMGTRLLPAQAARSPLVFALMDSATVDPILPANSQVAAPTQPAPPSPPGASEAQQSPPQTVVFATTETISLTRARLASVYSLSPASDEYADHTAHLKKGFTLFDDLQPVEHTIYLGHDHLFDLSDAAEIRLIFNAGITGKSEQPAAQDILSAIIRSTRMAWEYLSKDGWLPLKLDSGKTPGLKKDGRVTLRKTCGPAAKEDTIYGHKSFWIRGRLTIPLPPKDTDDAGRLPVIDDVLIDVSFTRDGLKPEAAFTDTLAVDTANNFYPFGKQPERYTTFYLASEEAFQRKGSYIRVGLTLSEPGAAGGDPPDPTADLVVSWEFFDGRNWKLLDDTYGFSDGTDRLTHSGSLTFICPSDWSANSVNGKQSYWLRGRIDSGGYGHPLQIKVVQQGNASAIEASQSTLRPPVISNVKLQYAYKTEAVRVNHCLTSNALVFSDHTEACLWPHERFVPFQAVEDRHPAVYFCFDRELPVGLVSMYAHVRPDPSADVAETEASDFVWEYRSDRGWTALGVLDETLGFRRSGMIQFAGSPDAIATPGIGGDLYRIRARLKEGERQQQRPINGLWLNAVWSTQQTTINSQVLGNSDGNPRQTFFFLQQRGPVLEGETIEVREWAGGGLGWDSLVDSVPERDLRFERDTTTGAVTGVWVRWHERQHLFDSGPGDRHYVIERAIGSLRFGDGNYGLIPPAGARISASYNTGGGLAGNLPPGTITELRSGVPYLQSVTNPVAAVGGTITETIEAVRLRGPERLRHRDRAVAAQDYEWMAREASPEVARSRCLPITGPDGSGERGWVTLVIVPYSMEAKPQPTPELQVRVRDYLATRVPAVISRNVRVAGAEYLAVSVIADVVPLRADEVAEVEARLLMRLSSFLHPLTGGADGQGWCFGQPVYLSQMAALIESAPGVDYALSISLRVGDQVFDEVVPVDPCALVASGEHEIKLSLSGSRPGRVCPGRTSVASL